MKDFDDICPACYKRFEHLNELHINECKAKQVKHLEDVLKRTLTDEDKESLWS